jgi:hypothetical protein
MMTASMTGRILSTVDRLSGELGPINTVVAAIADRIAPKAAAQAACPIPSGSCICSRTCGASCSGTGPYFFVTYKFAGNCYGCSAPNTCTYCTTC